MKKLLPAIISIVAAVLLAGGAQANGTGSIKDEPVLMPTGWSGFYFGLGVGYGDSVVDNIYTEDTGAFEVREGEGLRGGFGTVILGLDRQFREHWVVGAFVDFDWADIDLTYTDDVVGEETLTLEWMWSIGARIGYLINPSTLLYVAGGYTQAKFESDDYNGFIFNGTEFPGASSTTHDGYFVAFGLESMLRTNLFLRGEMRYAEYDSEISNSGSAGGESFVDEFEPTVWTGRFTLTYKIPHGNRTYEQPAK
jgi:outer membrane immunogenic protein